MRKSKKKKKAAAAAAAEEEVAAAEAAAKAEKEAAEMERLRAEQEAMRLEREENERRVMQDRAEKEELVMKLQAVHRGRASRKAARDRAHERHMDCDVRKKVHKKSTEAPKDEFFGQMFEEKRDKDYSSADDNVIADRSLFLLGEESGVRHTFNEILDHKITSTFIMCCILVNVVILSVETPTNTFDEETKSTLHAVDVLLSIIFSSEHDAAMLLCTACSCSSVLARLSR